MKKPRCGVLFVALIAAGLVGLSAPAASLADEARLLGGPVLTEWGAERAGNKEGTIPRYAGAGVKAPQGWDPKIPGQRPDPYGERPLFSITAQNAEQYAEKLDGMIEVFKRYPSFRMDVYPSHRDYVFPKHVLDNTIRNATACKAEERELKLVGCYGGLPFPLPTTGNQAMWNHLVNYQSWNSVGRAESWIVPKTGNPVLVERGDFLYNWPYYDPEKTGPHSADALYFRYRGKDEAPARLAGGQMMFHDPVDMLNIGRSAWLYVPGRRWTKVAADLAYDTSNPYAPGIATMDDSWSFMGALDRFDFKLIGKKEKFIYYNNFLLTDEKACPNSKILSNKISPHPDCVRWELHRVWVVQASVKPSFRHLYPKRHFFWDEDGYAAGQGENYDATGALYRLSLVMSYPYFEAPGGSAGGNVFMDLKTGTWAVAGMSGCSRCGWWPVSERISEMTFSPSAMAGEGIR